MSYQPVILVTGCASGIGLALAELLYEQREYRVVITARRGSVAELKKRFAVNERFWVHELDVTDDAQREALIADIDKRWGGVNILVNNAGISYRAVVEHMTDDDERKQMATNYIGPMGLTRLVLPSMRVRGRGKIINVSSVSGMLAMPTMGSYSASKYALEGASEALWYEMRPLGVQVCLVQPGFIHSNSFKKVYHTALSNPENWHGHAYSDYYRSMTPFVEKLMALSRATPEKVARLILKVIRQRNPPLWVPATLDAFVFYYMRRILPRRLLLYVLYNCLPGARRWAKGYSHKRDPHY